MSVYVLMKHMLSHHNKFNTSEISQKEERFWLLLLLFLTYYTQNPFSDVVSLPTNSGLEVTLTKRVVRVGS